MINKQHTQTHGSVIPLGFILVIGILIIFGSIITTTTLPIINQEREIQSHNELQTDMLNLASQTSTTTLNTPIPILLGNNINYILQNTKPTQTLHSTQADTLKITNAQHTHNNSTYTYQKQQTIFTVSRNYHYQPPTHEYAYENGIIITQPPETPPGNPQIIPQNNQPLIHNNHITLYHLKTAPNKIENPPSTITLTTTTKTTTITNTTTNTITLTIPTRIPQSEWETQLTPQLTTNNGHIQTITYQTTPNTHTNTLKLTLQQNTNYTLTTHTITIQ